MSRIATYVMLFSQHGARLVHRYRVFAYSVLYQSFRGLFMTKLSGFTHQASAKACSVAKRGRDSSAESTPSPLQSLPTPPSPLGPAHHTPDNAPPARKAALATATITSAAEVSANAPVFVYRAPMAPAVNWSSPGQLQPTSRMSLPRPQLAVSAPGPASAPARSRLMSLLLWIVGLRWDLARRPRATLDEL